MAKIGKVGKCNEKENRKTEKKTTIEYYHWTVKPEGTLLEGVENIHQNLQMQVVVWQLFWQHCEWYKVCSPQGTHSSACLSCIHKHLCWCQPWHWHYHFQVWGSSPSLCHVMSALHPTDQRCFPLFKHTEEKTMPDYLKDINDSTLSVSFGTCGAERTNHKKIKSVLYSWRISWCFEPRHLAQSGLKRTIFSVTFLFMTDAIIQTTLTCGRPFTYGKWQQLWWNCAGIQMYSSDDNWKLLWISIIAAISRNGQWSFLHPLYEYSLGNPCKFLQHGSSFVLTALHSWNQ